MKNFAEEIAYMYFRLNGFFLLDNYVTHAGEQEIRSHADSDLLGIKPSKVCEQIGLQGNKDVDFKLRELLGEYDFAGVICEVKGGENNTWTLAENRILPCLHRMGLLNREEIGQAEIVLKAYNSYTSKDSRIRILKIVATNYPNPEEIKTKWSHIPLVNMINFIEERAKKYPQKRRGWNFYSSNLFQYLIKQNQG